MTIIFTFIFYPLNSLSFFFFFNDTATTEIYTLSLHDALPISNSPRRSLRNMQPNCSNLQESTFVAARYFSRAAGQRDRESTRLDSRHLVISYAVFCL